MAQIIEVPKVGPVEFPDSMSDAQIVEAVKKLSGQSGNASTQMHGWQGVQPKPKATETWKNLLADVIATKPGPLGLPVAATAGAPIAGGPMAMAQGLAQSKVGELQGNAAYRAGGAVTDLAAPYVPPEVAGGMGYATNVGSQAAMSLLSGEMLKKLTQDPAQSVARFLMQSALKPSTANPQKGIRAVETLLQEGYNPTASGVAKMKAAIAQLEDDITKTLANSPATVDKQVVAGYLGDAMKKFEMRSLSAKDTRAIADAWTEFLSNPLIPDKVPVALANQIKRGDYQSIGEKAYGELKGAPVEAEKTLARGWKTEIGKAVPAVEPMNQRQGALINAEKLAEHRVAVDANKNPIGLGLLNPATLLAWLWDRSPGAKAAMARGLFSGQLPATTARLGTMPLIIESGRPPPEDK